MKKQQWLLPELAMVINEIQIHFYVKKLTGTKINLINQNRENIKNDLIVVNMNNKSTTQIKINSCRTTLVRQPNNKSKHWVTIARNRRMRIYLQWILRR
jgi:hypothetical protein